MSTRAAAEECVAPGVRLTFEAERVLYRASSTEQEKLLIENAQFGRMLMLDGVVQVTAADEFIYHEMMAHVPILAHGHVEHALIIGGGDCGLAEEVLKHADLKQLTQVEVDAGVVSLARSCLSEINAPVFQDARFDLQIGDGAEFVATTERRFDLILVDCTDPGALSSPLFTEAFYRDVRGCLAPGGLLVAQLGVPFLQQEHFTAGVKRLAKIFPEIACFLVPVPSYFGGPIAFGWASNVLQADAPSAADLHERYARARIETRYYTPDLHKAAFVLPKYLQESLKSALGPE